MIFYFLFFYNQSPTMILVYVLFSESWTTMVYLVMYAVHFNNIQ